MQIKQMMCYRQEGKKLLKLLSLLLVSLFASVNAFDFVTSGGRSEIPNDKHLIISKCRLKKGNITKKINIKKRITVVNNCIHKNTYNAIIDKMSQQYQVDKQLIKAIISIESCFNPKAVSLKGAQGLMQLMPFTAKRFDVKDSFDPAQNIMGGVKYLHYLLRRFKGDRRLVIAAYNAGEGAVDHYAGIPPYKETQDYVIKVLGLLGRRHKIIRKDATKECTLSKEVLDHTYVYFGSNSIKYYYLVRQNDTLVKISNRVGLSVAKIQAINRLNQYDNLKSSQLKTLLLSTCSLQE